MELFDVPGPAAGPSRLVKPVVVQRAVGGTRLRKNTRVQVESTVILFSNQTLKPGGAFKLGSSLHRPSRGGGRERRERRIYKTRGSSKKRHHTRPTKACDFPQLFLFFPRVLGNPSILDTAPPGGGGDAMIPKKKTHVKRVCWLSFFPLHCLFPMTECV